MIDSIKISIWGRDFILPILYNCYAGEKVTKSQIKALNMFVQNDGLIEKSKKYVEDYCRSEVMADVNNSNKDNIFTYVKPVNIFVKHEKINPRVAIMCKYRYDTEHGLAVVFMHDGKIIVGNEDIII